MTKGESPILDPNSRVVWLLFSAVIVVVYLSALTMPLIGPDEPRYAQVAREMFERGDWITPTLGGFNWFEKPALLYWLEIAAYNVFGVSEFSARLGPALFGLGTVLSLWLLGRYVDCPARNGERQTANNFANWLGLVAASTVALVAFSHGASFDIILTFPVTAAMVSYFIYETGQRPGWLVSFYCFAGLAVLAKGLIGIVFPFAIVAFYHLLLWRSPDKALLFSLFWGTLVAGAIAGVWYVPMYLRHGYEFFDQFFVQHHFQRYTSNKYLHPQPFYFFFWVLPLMTIPWLPFFIASLLRLAKKAVRLQNTEPKKGEDVRSASGPHTSLVMFSFAWMAVPLVFFSFSGSKLPGYILPAIPAAIILAADQVYAFVQKSAWRRYAIQLVAAGTFVCIFITAVAFAPTFAEGDSVKGLFAVADGRGLNTLPVLLLHGVSHNAEFYAPGRIIRDANGKQKTVFGPQEVLREIRALGDKPLLVLVPHEYLQQLTQSDVLRVEALKSNDTWDLMLVSAN